MIPIMLFFLAILVTPLQAVADGVQVGTFGNVWKIAEKDPVLEIRDALDQKKDEIEKRLGDLKKKAELTVRSAYSLPPAKENKVFYVDTRYTLPDDVFIRDKHGHPYYYPAGTTYNPLDYLPDFPVYVVFNPNDSKEVEWVKKFTSRTKGDIRYLVTSYPDNPKTKLPDQPIRFLSEKIAKFFGLEGTISIIRRDGEKIKVRQVCLF